MSLADSLHIVHYPHPALRETAAAIDEITDEVRAVARRMLELMREEEGLGLAAPQVALPWRLFVTAAQDGEPEHIYINPHLTGPAGDSETREEGCLSLPDVHVEVRRPPEISITATNLEGETFTLRSDKLIARVWQHEFDHLSGVLIIDKMSPMDRLANRKAIKALKAAAK